MATRSGLKTRQFFNTHSKRMLVYFDIDQTATMVCKCETSVCIEFDEEGRLVEVGVHLV